LTDLSNNTVACIDSASCLIFSKPFYFKINQLFKAHQVGEIALGTQYVISNDEEAVKKLKHFVHSKNQKSGWTSAFCFLISKRKVKKILYGICVLVDRCQLSGFSTDKVYIITSGVESYKMQWASSLFHNRQLTTCIERFCSTEV